MGRSVVPIAYIFYDGERMKGKDKIHKKKINNGDKNGT